MSYITGGDNRIIVWDCGTGQPFADIELADIPLCAGWNWEGSRIVTSCKDRKIRILDPRKGSVIKVRSALLRFVNIRFGCKYIGN